MLNFHEPLSLNGSSSLFFLCVWSVFTVNRRKNSNNKRHIKKVVGDRWPTCVLTKLIKIVKIEVSLCVKLLKKNIVTMIAAAPAIPVSVKLAELC